LIGDRREVGIGGRPQLPDQGRERITEVFVLAPAKAVPAHDHLAAEALLLMVKTRNALCLRERQELRHDSPTLGVEIGMQLHPVDVRHPALDRV
jgi:hypothetical protein